jgi:hypothetical protein
MRFYYVLQHQKGVQPCAIKSYNVRKKEMDEQIVPVVSLTTKSCSVCTVTTLIQDTHHESVLQVYRC